jgi:hypothetical protein
MAYSGYSFKAILSIAFDAQCYMTAKRDTEFKISKCLKVTDFINIIFKSSKVQTHSRIKIDNALALSTLLYGSENCTIKAEDKITWFKEQRMDDLQRDFWTEAAMGQKWPNSLIAR